MPNLIQDPYGGASSWTWFRIHPPPPQNPGGARHRPRWRPNRLTTRQP